MASPKSPGFSEPGEDEDRCASLSVFRQVQGIRVPAPPFLETRVLAALRERRRRAPRQALWRWLALASSATLIAVAGFELSSRMPPAASYTAGVHQAMLVSVEIRPLEGAGIAFAQIELPEGVSFYSKAHPEVSERRELRISWAPGTEPGISRFPFAIEGASPGVRTVRVLFLDADRRPVLTRSYRIRFTEEAKG